MASLIKNQLLKHLSIYIKNLSSDKINLSAFRGEGELSNLQLDEDVLTELLELPSWLRLTSAWCNHVSFRISWTKLKSVPIVLMLDEVTITVETCSSNKRSQDLNSPTLQSLPQMSDGKYSFVHKVIDGITVFVNSVNIKFFSTAFTASVQMSRICVESKTPKWASGDLRFTRLKDPNKGVILIFKELSWQTVRIEASSTQDKTLSPLRLLTNQARCRITIRKRLSDCLLLSSRLILLLDDLLWVLTDSQLKAALHFIDSLTGFIKSATSSIQKKKAAKKLITIPEYQLANASGSSRKEDIDHMTTAQKMFAAFDIHETSYHFFSQRIDLHLCDDEGDGRSIFPDLRKGGALQLTLQAFQIDYYPYHLAKADCKNWTNYKEDLTAPAVWLKESLASFCESIQAVHQSSHPLQSDETFNLKDLLPKFYNSPLSNHGTQPNTPLTPQANDPLGCLWSNPVANESAPIHEEHTIAKNLSKLMSVRVILRLEDFVLYRVTTAGKKQTQKELIFGDKKRFSFPSEMAILHAEYTYFYYPSDLVYFLPSSKAFIFVNPVQIHLDMCSILWLNSFVLNLYKSFPHSHVFPLERTAAGQNYTSPDGEPHGLLYMDVRMEAIMPRIILESTFIASNQKSRPKMLQIQISRFELSNMRDNSSRADLLRALHSLQEGSLVFGTDFPSLKDDKCIITDKILSYVGALIGSPEGTAEPTTSPAFRSKSNSMQSLMHCNAKLEPHDIWYIKLDPIWIDFLGSRSLGTKKFIPFVDAVPITVWLYTDTSPIGSGDCSNGMNPFKTTNLHSTQERRNLAATQTNLHAIAHIGSVVSVQLDHFQYLLLLRLVEEMNEVVTFLHLDTKRIIAKVAGAVTSSDSGSIVFGCVVPEIEVTLVMPSPASGKESSGAEDPASTSFTEDLPMNNQVNRNICNSVGDPQDMATNCMNDDSREDAASQQICDASTPNIPREGSSTISQNSSDTFVNHNNVTSSKTIPTSDNSNTNPINLSKELNSSLMSMKKGFSSLMTSIDSAIKSGGGNDASDTFSFQSDISSDSENLALVWNDDNSLNCTNLMFRKNPFAGDTSFKDSHVELASEVYEDEKTRISLCSSSEHSDIPTFWRRSTITAVTFRLRAVEVIRQSDGNDSTLRLQVASVSTEESGTTLWDDLQSKLAARSKTWMATSGSVTATPCVQLRLKQTFTEPNNIELLKDKGQLQSCYHNHAEAHIRDTSVALSMSSVLGLSDLIEDELVSYPLPVDVVMENVKVSLTEDRLANGGRSCSQGPINLVIGRMNLRRDEQGVLHVEPNGAISSVGSSMNSASTTATSFGIPLQHLEQNHDLLSKQLMQQLKLDNEHLRLQLGNAKENLENYRLKTNEEMNVLRGYLKVAQDEARLLVEEKKTWMDTIKSLQTQIAMHMNEKTDGNR